MKNKKKTRIYYAASFLLIIILLFVYGFWYMTECSSDWKGTTIEAHNNFDRNKIKHELLADVAYMSDSIGERNFVRYKELEKCRKWIKAKWEKQGYKVIEHKYFMDGKEYANLIVEIRGQKNPEQIIIIGNQYDTLPDSPGANNNAGGVAVVFQLTKMLKDFKPDKTLRFIAFTNEEDPIFGTEQMGSYIYAKNSSEKKENIQLMLALDAIGYYSNRPKSQNLPWPFSIFYPDTGNFLAFIGDFSSRKYMKDVTRGFKIGSSFPIEAGVVPKWVEGASWADHQSFWIFGFPAIMITDTGGFRSPYHTTKYDTMEKMNFDALTSIVYGMYGAIMEISSS